MTIGRICSRDPVTVQTGEPLSHVARLMREKHVGAVVAVRQPLDRPVPAGMVTDRDIVRAQLEKAADLNFLCVEEVMSRNPLVLEEHMTLREGIERLRAREVRRAPVVDRTGALIGVVSTDDIVAALADELSDLARLIANQPRHEGRR
jgi:CBS domain-containing protein